MQSISVSRNLPHDISTVWDAISDVGGIHKFNPMVDTSPLMSKEKTGLDCTRQCNFYDGTSIVEKVTEFEEGKFLKLELSEMSMPMKIAFATMSVTQIDKDATLIELKMDYVMKYGLMGKMMGVMMKPMMKSMFRKVLKGLEDHLTTGQVIGEGGKVLAA